MMNSYFCQTQNIYLTSKHLVLNLQWGALQATNALRPAGESILSIIVWIKRYIQQDLIGNVLNSIMSAKIFA